MDEMPSSEFRKRYATLAKPTIVTVNGHHIGTWLPGEELVKALDQAQSCGFCGVMARVAHAAGCADPEFLADKSPISTRPSAQAQRDLLRKINRG